MKIYIIHYNQKEQKFMVHTPGYGQPEFTDEIILKDAVFFVAPSCADIIRERASILDIAGAKFPHAFAMGTSREQTMDVINDTSLVWHDFEYDVLRHDAFVLKDTQEPITGIVKYLMIRGKELKVNL